MTQHISQVELQTLSHRQLHVWQAQQLDALNPVYNVACALSFSGQIEREQFNQALRLLIDRHPVIHSSISQGDDHPQLAIKNGLFSFLDVPKDLREQPPTHIAKQLIEQTIDIEKETFQFYLLNDDSQHILVIKGHHINCDQWSLQVLVSDLLACLESVLDNCAHDLLDVQYKYSYQDKTSDVDLDLFPVEFFTPDTIPTEHHFDGVSTRVESCEGLDWVKESAKHYGVTAFSVVLASTFATLYHMTGQTDLTIGIPMARRTRKTRLLLGHYSDVEPLSISDIDTLSLSELVLKVSSGLTQLLLSHEPNSNAAKYINVTCNYLAKLKTKGIRADITPLMIGRKGYQTQLGQQHVIVKGIPVEPSIAQFDIEFTHFETSGGLGRKIVANKAMFAPETLSRFGDVQFRFLQALQSQQQGCIASLPILTQAEKNTLLSHGNNAAENYTEMTSLSHTFQQQVNTHPDNIAIFTEHTQLSYRELEQRSNQVANLINARFEHLGQTPAQAHIALYMEPSVDMLIAILAIVKVGAVYIPLSPDHASTRTDFILQDTAPALLIIDSELHQEVQQKIELLNITTQLIEVDAAMECSQCFAESGPQSQDIAYIIYTSGTTGKPKGVMQTHHNVLRLFTSTAQNFQFTHSDRWVLYHAYTFDFSVWEMWGALLHGGALFIPKKSQIRDFAAFAKTCSQQKISVLNQTPSAFYEFSNQAIEQSLDFSALRFVIFGGDKLNSEMLLPWWQHYGDNHPLLINMYGITETTVHVTYKELTVHSNTKASFIGRPISDMTAYVLNSHMQQTEVGALGELYVGGAGLARGYLNRDDLSTERFISNPFATADEQSIGYNRLYKTGDVVRQLPQGELEYIGRNDGQVKIRGYRIELGEIESILSQHASVDQAVVIDRQEQASKYLAAYVKKSANKEISTSELRTYLVANLPDYMCPKTITELDEIPLTSNGKIDRKALPLPTFESDSQYCEPTSELEQILCNAFASLLGREKVGVKDDFFNIGGDSILTIQLVAQLRKQSIELQVKDIFECTCAQTLALRIIDLKENQRHIVTETGALTGSFSLLPIQSWFFNLALENPNYWNQCFSVLVPKSVSYDALSHALEQLSTQHDMLRCRFDTENHLQQYVLETGMAELLSIDTTALSEDTLIAQLNDYQANFNLTDGPLWQAILLTDDSQTFNRVFFAVHHLLIDAVSWRIIAQDLQSLLQEQPLIEKRSSYRQWVNAMSNYAQLHADEQQFWLDTLSHAPQLPDKAHEKQTQWLEFDNQFTDQLLTSANKGFNTNIEELLLSALAISLGTSLQQSSPIITLESHGRELWCDDLDINNTVGWFTSLYPLKLNTATTINQTIIQVKEALRKVPNKGVGFGAHHAHNPQWQLPPLSFNYLGQLSNATQSEWQIDGSLQTSTVDHRNTSHLLLDINALIQDKKLRIKIDAQLPPETAFNFKKALQEAIKRVVQVAFETAQKGTVTTPSDFDVKGLSVDHLTQLKNKVISAAPKAKTPKTTKNQQLEI
ncbi:non-ribosomal peptide synthetase [Pseudoalteromonas sp. MMG005]|uniref:non-ribosomal peptide synthetase n=1 Tax=Pseudoalteromonas sp. MMG005 TaxID=2822682 RepID=UPI001B39E6AA|nr:non-ribosomal peptide synthetase [Pseudoalteromonas sp. MMG005]MBQ4845082.1 amino acid adenylation domain-containing protein [Pseudoalteromonas sp. MMG005]